MRQMDLFSYSIIIPHRNLPKLLERCLASIPERPDVQVIIVDDASDPAKVDFQEFPGRERTNTEIILNKESLGAGHARNLGLAKATGKWLVFADCDDFFDKDTLNAQMDACIDSDADILFFKIRYLYSDTLEATPREHWTNSLFDKVRETGDVNYMKLRRYAPWGKFIRRTLVERNKIEFQEVLWSNDVRFSMDTALAAGKVECVPEYLYCYTIRRDSLIAVMTPESLLCRFNVSLDVERKLRERGLSKYSPRHLPYWWFKILRRDKKLALKLIPKIVPVIGPGIFIRSFLSNVYHRTK